MNWYLNALKNYACFTGRSRRKEYWMFVLFNVIFSFVLGFIDGLVGTFDSEIGLGILGGMYSLVILIPGLAVSVRRLHDTGKSGSMIFVGLIPLIGWIWLIILMTIDSDPGENKYGTNPQEVD